jgi:CBS domain containing-hemolysin-like protein
MLDRPRSLLITILLLNTIANVGAAILSAVLTLEAARSLGWSETIALVLEITALTFVLLVVSEVAPKLAASRSPVAFAKRSSILLYPLARFLAPLTTLMAHGTAWLQKHLRSPAQPLSSEDVKTMADVGKAQGSLEEEERALIHSILEFGETTVREVMISRVDMIALPDTATLAEVLQLIRDSGHSRLPLFRDHLDNILGVVYAKDLLPLIGHNGDSHRHPLDLEKLARQPRFVPLSKKLDDMLEDFQEHSTHMAIVVDEYGGTAGLVTLEDLLEEVVGEIWDEMDVPEQTLIRAAGPNAWRVEARIDLDDLVEALGIDFDTEEFDFETLGGLVFHLAGDVPSSGDELTHGRLQLRVESVEGNRIREVLVTLLPETETAEEG